MEEAKKGVCKGRGEPPVWRIIKKDEVSTSKKG